MSQHESETLTPHRRIQRKMVTLAPDSRRNDENARYMREELEALGEVKALTALDVLTPAELKDAANKMEASRWLYENYLREEVDPAKGKRLPSD